MEHKEITEEQIKLLDGIMDAAKERFIWVVADEKLDGEHHDVWVKSNRDLDSLAELGLIEQMFDETAITVMNKLKMTSREVGEPERDYRCFKITEVGWAFFEPTGDWKN